MLGERIRAARLELGLSQGELAGTELSRSLISELERNKRRPSTDTIEVLARRLNKPLTYFMVSEHEVIQDRAILAMSHAHNLIALGQAQEAIIALAPVAAWLTELSAPARARYHELQAWLEQSQKNTLGSINHALTAAQLYNQLEQAKKEWYCLYLAASAAYDASLYEQCIEVVSRALTMLIAHPELQREKRLSLNLVGSAYFSLGKIELADRHYAEALSCPGENDANTLIRLYHGRSICAQQQGNLEASLRWSEAAAALSRKKLDEKLAVHNEINRGICLIQLHRIGDAMRILEEQEAKSSLPPALLELGYREYLLVLAELNPYPESICLRLEALLESLLGNAASQADYAKTKGRWALAKSRLRRQSGAVIRDTVLDFAEQFKTLGHNRRAAEVLEYGAKLSESEKSFHSSYELLKLAIKLK